MTPFDVTVSKRLVGYALTITKNQKPFAARFALTRKRAERIAARYGCTGVPVEVNA